MSVGVDNLVYHKGTLGQRTSPDQRHFRRFGVKFPCHVRPRASPKYAVLAELEAETLDVSRGGLFFLASVGLTVGTAIEFELDLPVDVSRRPVSIHCRGTITRVVPHEGGRVGIGATIEHYKISTLRQASLGSDDKAASLVGRESPRRQFRVSDGKHNI
jgi:hypothetical protein